MAYRKIFRELESKKILPCIFLCLAPIFLAGCATAKKPPVPGLPIETDGTNATEESEAKTEESEESIAEKLARDLEIKRYNETHFQDGTEIVTSKTAFDGRDTLLLTFGGDLMAHPALWRNGGFERIYEEIESYVQESDFSFVNVETPVYDARPYSGYPAFNVHHEYVDAAIKAGFNVFSLTNNHTNDQGFYGITATREYFRQKAEELKSSERPIYYAGLKEQSNGPLTYQVIKKNGWTILFVAITELLNSSSNSSIIDYVPPNTSSRNSFVEKIKKLEQENPADLFILSIHCSDPEYVFDIRSTQTAWYERLLNTGADVIWVNHPHVAKDWELYPDADNVPRKMIFHSMGNLVSKHETRNNTGEGFLTQVRFEKTDDGIRIVGINPILLTTYQTKDNHYVIRKLDGNFLGRLKNEDPYQLNFFTERKTFMKKISGKVKWQ